MSKMNRVRFPFLVLKIGGSLFSDKRRNHHIDKDAVETYSRLVADLMTSHRGRFALIVGGGSFGHGAVRSLNPADSLSGVLLTEASFRLKWIWTQELRRHGAPAVPLQLQAMCTLGEDGVEVHDGALARFLEIGALPVLAGDCLLGPDDSLQNYSSDRVPEVLMSCCEPPIRIVSLTDEPGILLDGPGGSEVLRGVDADAPDEAYDALWEAPPWDISGSMTGKVTSLVEFARRGAECFIMKGDPTLASLRFICDPPSTWPLDVLYTRIARGRDPVSRTNGLSHPIRSEAERKMTP
jgi:isopentenyl phosphate kinase